MTRKSAFIGMGMSPRRMCRRRLPADFHRALSLLGAHPGGHAKTRLLEGFFEGSYDSMKEVLLSSVLRRRGF